MMIPALRYLTLRALGAPAVLLSLAMQGVFRGFKDTKTPLYATGKTKATILESLSTKPMWSIRSFLHSEKNPMWFHFLPC